MKMFDRQVDGAAEVTTPPRAPLLFGAFSIFALICLRWPSALVAVAAPAVVVGILWAASYTRHHTKWLVLPMLLNEALASVNLIDDSVRPILRYSLLALFCGPLLPAAFKTELLRRGGFKLYGLYFLWGVITVFYSIYPFYSLGRVSSAAVLFAAVVTVTSKVEGEAEIYELMKIFWIGSAILMGILAASVLALPSDVTWKLDDNGMLRFTGVFNNPNQIGELMLTTVAAGVILWPGASKRNRVAIVLTSAAALTFDAMADSRSPFIALSVGAFLLAIRKYRMRALVVGGALLGVSIILFTYLESSQDYVTRGDVTSLTGRTEIWKYVIHSIRERPLTGWGFEVEGQIFQNRDFPMWEEIWNEGPRSSLHSGYLSRAVGVGIPATLLWLFVILRALGFAAFRGKSSVLRDAVLVCSVPVLIVNLVESTAGDCRYSVGLLMAIVWALSEKARLLALAHRSTEDVTSPLPAQPNLFSIRKEIREMKPQLHPL